MALNDEFKQLLMQKMKSSNSDILILRECLADFKNRGIDEERMYRTLEEMRIGCDEETKDILLELMDFVSGFCNPTLRIF